MTTALVVGLYIGIGIASIRFLSWKIADLLWSGSEPDFADIFLACLAATFWPFIIPTVLVCKGLHLLVYGFRKP